MNQVIQPRTPETNCNMRRIFALTVVALTLGFGVNANAVLVDYEFTSNEGFEGTLSLETDFQVAAGSNFEYFLTPNPGIAQFDFFHPLNAANDFNQDDGGNDCCMVVITDGAGNLIELDLDVDDVAGTASGSFVFGSIDFSAGTGQIDGAPALALTGVLSSIVTANAVPEPTTAVLGLMGLGGLVMRRRRAA